MNRRTFFCALAAMPMLATTQLRRPLGLSQVSPGDSLRFVSLDGIPPTRLVMDRYAPIMTILSIGGIAFVGPDLAYRLPPPDCVVDIPHGHPVKGWRLA